MNVMKCFHTDKPEGTFFAVYSDLSGAYLFTQEGDKFYQCVDSSHGYVDADWFVDAGYLWFFNVDDYYAKLTFENDGD